MAISEADKARARSHLGYMAVTTASSFAFGIPQLTQTQWMLEDAITRVRTESEARVVELLNRLDCIDDALFAAHGDLFAKRIEGLEVNLEQPDALEKEYARWAQRLADLLGVMPYPFAPRFQSLMQAGVMNVRVGR